MILDSLKLLNFKNYRSCSLNFNPGFNFIYGNNGNGKTNILEAISMLCFTKSFLQNSEIDCIKYGENNFEIIGECINYLGTKNKIRYSFDNELQKKEIVYNNEIIQRFSSFFGTLPLVVLSPYDLKLTAGTPNDKRRNFDILISQVSKIYFSDLKDLTKLVKQKNSLLRDELYYKKYSRTKLVEMLESWNEKLVDLSVRIIMKRVDFINEYRSYVHDAYCKINDSDTSLEIKYSSESIEDGLADIKDENQITDCIKSTIQQKMELEISRGVSLVGPHRDNYVFNMIKNGDTFELKSFASQGEHKSFIVAMKIAEYKYLKEKRNKTDDGEPIILLDDLFSELDSSRTEKIGAMFKDLNQIFLTTTDLRYLDIVKKYYNKEEISSYYVNNGTAQKIT